MYIISLPPLLERALALSAYGVPRYRIGIHNLEINRGGGNLGRVT